MTIRAKDPHKLLWIVLSLGFIALALDELLQFHDRLGPVIDRYASSGVFRAWNDIIVILYGVVALPILAMLLPSILRFRMLPELLAVSFAFYGIHTLVDATQSSSRDPIILEESAKLFCGSFLALSAFVGFLGCLWNSAPPCEAPSDAGPSPVGSEAVTERGGQRGA